MKNKDKEMLIMFTIKLVTVFILGIIAYVMTVNDNKELLVLMEEQLKRVNY